MQRVIFTSLVVWSALWGGPLHAGVERGILNIHTTFSGDPRHEVTVSWRTRDALYPPRVQVVHAGDGAETARDVAGVSVPSAGGYNHHVALTNLAAGSEYHYRVSGRAGTWGPVCRFRTAPATGDVFTFAVVGDVQGKEAPSEVWQAAGVFLADQPDVLFTWLMGDLVDTGFSQTQWDAFFNSLAQAHRRDLFHTMVVMPLIGNHDTYGGLHNREGMSRYLDQFRLPPNGQGEWENHYYQFSILGARFVALDTEGAVADRPAYMAGQTRWLSRLEWGGMNWTFVAHHRPVVPFRRHVPSAESRYIWRPHFWEPYADIVFNGHNHSQAVSWPLRAERLDGMQGGVGFAGAWQAKTDRGDATGLSNLLLLEENQLIRYPGYQAVGRSVSTRAAGALNQTALSAERPLAPLRVEPGTELWLGYVYQKRDGWYAENQGGWRLLSRARPDHFLQVATTRVDDADQQRFGHFRLDIGSAQAATERAIAREGRTHIPEEPFFVLVRFVFEQGRTRGFLKAYRAPAPLPESLPREWDAVVEWPNTMALDLDTLILLGEDERRYALMDELRIGRRMEEVLLRSEDGHRRYPRPLVEERFDQVPTVDRAAGVIYYDAGGINASGAANEEEFIRFREDRLDMPLLALVTVTPRKVQVRTVYFADYGTNQAGDIADAFTLER